MKNKIIDCITFFNENFIFDLRYNIIKDSVDFIVVCESEYDHRGNKKKLNFNYTKYSSDKKLKYFILKEPFPKNNNPWINQAIQREFLLKNLNFVNDDDYIFFSYPDEIPNVSLFQNFKLEKNMEYFYKKVLIINLTFLTNMKHLGMDREFVKKKSQINRLYATESLGQKFEI